MEESTNVSQEDGQPPPGSAAGAGAQVSSTQVSGAPVAVLTRVLLSGSCLAVLAGVLWLLKRGSRPVVESEDHDND